MTWLKDCQWLVKIPYKKLFQQFLSKYVLFIASITGILYTLKRIFAGDDRKSQSSNIICSPLSVSISHYLQIFSACHQGVNDIFALKSISVFIFQLPKTWRHYSEDITVRWRDEDITVSSFSLKWRNDLGLYNRMILALIIMFIYSGIVVIWDNCILVCYLQCHFVRQIRLSSDKSKFTGLKWQKCHRNEHHCFSNMGKIRVKIKKDN